MQSKPTGKHPMPGSPEPPAGLVAEYGAWSWTVVWQYGPEVICYRLERNRLEKNRTETHFLKMSQGAVYPSIADERIRMSWAVNHLPVPRVIQHGSEDGVSWLVTDAIPGNDATDRGLMADPRRLVPVLADGLRRFHAAPVEHCPFDFSLAHALPHVRHRLEMGQIRPGRDFHEEFAHLSAEGAVALLEESRPHSEDLVVCHGDYCPPNIIVEGGVATGFVDLGELGVADRWWDLAVATWSLNWNLGPGYEDLFLDAYGIPRDEDRIRFYRLLYDLVS